MAKKLLFAFGVSLIISTIIGFVTSERKYYFLPPNKPKREITYQTYLSYFDKTEYKVIGSRFINTMTSNFSEYSKYTTEEKVYNIQYAIISGLITLGISSIILSLNRKNTI